MKIIYSLILYYWMTGSLIAQGHTLLPDEFFNRNDTSWYNRKTGSALHFVSILNGEHDKAIAFARSQLPDQEAEFILAVGYAAKGNADSSLYFIRSSLAKQLPISRYLAGGLKALKPLRSIPEFQEIVAEFNPTVLHGPMLGNMTANSVDLWLRTYGEKEFAIEVSQDESFRKIDQKFDLKTLAEKEFTGLACLMNLKSSTTYYYRLQTQGSDEIFKGSFKTLPKDREPSTFTITFGGGAAFIPWRHSMWSTIYSHRPDAMFMMGDNVYIDYPEVPQAQQYCYHQRQSETHWRRMVANTPIYAIWDDHDFGDNDDYGGLEKYTPAWKYDNWKRFQNQWVNPAYGLGSEIPGVWFNKVMGEVEFFFLDGRYYREPSFIDVEKDHNLSMLGPVQKRWLKKSLESSKAKFKVIISPVPWSYDAKKALEGRNDTWLGYPEEREEIFDFLTEKEISGVVLLSADRHRSDLWKIERDDDYPLYELESSRLTNTHRHPPIPTSLFSYNAKDSFGKVTFNTHVKDPHLVYEIWTIDNEKVFEYKILLSELEPFGNN